MIRPTYKMLWHVFLKKFNEKKRVKKMEKPKIIRLVLIVLVITTILGCIPIAMACGGKGKINIRPIEAWPLEDMVPLGGMQDWDKDLLVWPFLVDPENFIWDVSYNDRKGFILERELKDNEILASVNLRVKGAPFYITIPSDGLGTPVFYGVMDFMYQLRFTIDLDTLGPDDYDDDGNIIYQPWWWYVLDLNTYISVFVCGSGSGEFVDSYDGYEAGDTAKMNTIHFMVHVEDYKGPLLYNPYGLNGVILVDNINFH